MAPNVHLARTAIRAYIVGKIRETGKFGRVEEYLKYKIEDSELPVCLVYFEDGNPKQDRLSSDDSLTINIVGENDIGDEALDELAAAVSEKVDHDNRLGGLADKFQYQGYSYGRDREAGLSTITLTYNIHIDAEA